LNTVKIDLSGEILEKLLGEVEKASRGVRKRRERQENKLQEAHVEGRDFIKEDVAAFGFLVA